MANKVVAKMQNTKMLQAAQISQKTLVSYPFRVIYSL